MRQFQGPALSVKIHLPKETCCLWRVLPEQGSRDKWLSTNSLHCAVLLPRMACSTFPSPHHFLPMYVRRSSFLPPSQPFICLLICWSWRARTKSPSLPDTHQRALKLVRCRHHKTLPMSHTANPQRPCQAWQKVIHRWTILPSKNWWDKGRDKGSHSTQLYFYENRCHC